MLLVTATGSGKSLIPLAMSLTLPMARHEPDLVVYVSPFVATLDSMVIDKLASLRQRLAGSPTPVKYVALAGNDRVDGQRVNATALQSCRLLLLGPTALTRPNGFELMQSLRGKGRVKAFIFDEADAFVSAASFRSELSKVPMLLRVMFPETPFLVMTATCPVSRQEGMARLFHSELRVVRGPCSRTNLSLRCMLGLASKDQFLAAVLDKIIAPEGLETTARTYRAIVFCGEKAEAFNLRLMLKLTLEDTFDQPESGGVHATPRGNLTFCGVYVGESARKHKEQVLAAFRQQGGSRVIIATSALSQGLDIAGIDTVVFAGLPYTAEQFVQGGGRAGRSLPDESLAQVWLLTLADGLSMETVTNSGQKLTFRRPNVDPVLQAYTGLGPGHCHMLYWSGFLDDASTGLPPDHWHCGHCQGCSDAAATLAGAQRQPTWFETKISVGFVRLDGQSAFNQRAANVVADAARHCQSLGHLFSVCQPREAPEGARCRLFHHLCGGRGQWNSGGKASGCYSKYSVCDMQQSRCVYCLRSWLRHANHEDMLWCPGANTCKAILTWNKAALAKPMVTVASGAVSEHQTKVCVGCARPLKTAMANALLLQALPPLERTQIRLLAPDDEIVQVECQNEWLQALDHASSKMVGSHCEQLQAKGETTVRMVAFFLFWYARPWVERVSGLDLGSSSSSNNRTQEADFARFVDWLLSPCGLVNNAVVLVAQRAPEAARLFDRAKALYNALPANPSAICPYCMQQQGSSLDQCPNRGLGCNRMKGRCWQCLAKNCPAAIGRQGNCPAWAAKGHVKPIRFRLYNHGLCDHCALPVQVHGTAGTSGCKFREGPLWDRYPIRMLMLRAPFARTIHLAKRWSMPIAYGAVGLSSICLLVKKNSLTFWSR